MTRKAKHTISYTDLSNADDASAEICSIDHYRSRKAVLPFPVCCYKNYPCRMRSLSYGRERFLFKIGYTALEKGLILDAVYVGAAIRGDTLAVTHFTENTSVGRDDTLDSVH